MDSEERPTSSLGVNRARCRDGLRKTQKALSQTLAFFLALSSQLKRWTYKTCGLLRTLDGMGRLSKRLPRGAGVGCLRVGVGLASVSLRNPVL
jgi:hypothetical protein